MHSSRLEAIILTELN